LSAGAPNTAWNAYIERFNRSYRAEVLNAQLFESIAKLRAHVVENNARRTGVWHASRAGDTTRTGFID
jgi:hypothetical protein